jgi:hypothetical protein
MCTTWFSITKLCVLHTECVCAFRTILTTLSTATAWYCINTASWRYDQSDTMTVVQRHKTKRHNDSCASGTTRYSHMTAVQRHNAIQRHKHSCARGTTRYSDTNTGVQAAQRDTATQWQLCKRHNPIQRHNDSCASGTRQRHNDSCAAAQDSDIMTVVKAVQHGTATQWQLCKRHNMAQRHNDSCASGTTQ